MLRDVGDRLAGGVVPGAFAPVSKTTSVVLYPEADMVAAIQQAMLTDPVLRQAVEDAIRARIAQDPEFAAFFAALLAGG